MDCKMYCFLEAIIIHFGNVTYPPIVFAVVSIYNLPRFPTETNIMEQDTKALDIFRILMTLSARLNIRGLLIAVVQS